MEPLCLNQSFYFDRFLDTMLPYTASVFGTACLPDAHLFCHVFFAGCVACIFRTICTCALHGCRMVCNMEKIIFALVDQSK